MKQIEDYISKNLQTIRKERGLSLDKTAKITEVSKAMLAQIERGDSVPTVTTLWKIANGLKVSFSSLISQQTNPIRVIKKQDRHLITEEKNHYRVHAAVPFSPEKQFEVFTVELDPENEHKSSPHNPGVEEHVFVQDGQLEMDIDGTVETIDEGEAIIFDGNQTHIYRNIGDKVLHLLVLIYYAK
ncbi:XRE family transcriptional regulator [Oceanobacillus sp. FSL W8-0428]|uniref:Transcriptional regulator n=1 Tax=Oceanobacillus sojae TaxID=582851 RepID=A0A511ZM96_9BACI|nr:XRE family transcriptional regulator [Oceanobacillus sojae]GEN88566.1 transcriptional regulator [Oceanobacillus sojae]